MFRDRKSIGVGVQSKRIEKKRKKQDSVCDSEREIERLPQSC